MRQLTCLISLMTLALIALSPARGQTVLREEHFDRDPGWDAHNNRLSPDPTQVPEVIQDFGYSNTNFAGGSAGELGGQIWRCAKPAFYARRIPVKTLRDKLTASGKLAFTSAKDGSGAWFGWFDSRQDPGMARPKNSLGLNFGFQDGGGGLKVMLSNDKNRFCGTAVTPHIGGAFRFSPLAPGIPYLWTLTYDPKANSGHGRVEFTIKSLATSVAQRERYAEMRRRIEALPARERAKFGEQHGRPDFDGGKPFIIDLPPGFKEEGASFDHFGLANIMKPGRPVSIYFDDLEYDGVAERFSEDPQWDASGNRDRAREDYPTGCHNFGFSPATSMAGGSSPGEMGGVIWRLSRAHGYYADRVGPLSLGDPLEAHGKLMLKTGSPDSEMCFGWFNSSPRQLPAAEGGKKRDGHLSRSENFIGAYVAGPSRLGRCLKPAVVSAKGTRQVFGVADQAPRPTPGKVYEWDLKYDPIADNGNGLLTIILGDQSATLKLDPALRKEGAVFDRFGCFASGGAGMVEIYFDDLKYTGGTMRKTEGE